MQHDHQKRSRRKKDLGKPWQDGKAQPTHQKVGLQQIRNRESSAARIGLYGHG